MISISHDEIDETDKNMGNNDSIYRREVNNIVPQLHPFWSLSAQTNSFEDESRGSVCVKFHNPPFRNLSTLFLTDATAAA